MFLFFLLLQQTVFTETAVRTVETGGSDQPGCLEGVGPCLTLNYALTELSAKPVNVTLKIEDYLATEMISISNARDIVVEFDPCKLLQTNDEFGGEYLFDIRDSQRLIMTSLTVNNAKCGVLTLTNCQIFNLSGVTLMAPKETQMATYSKIPFHLSASSQVFLEFIDVGIGKYENVDDSEHYIVKLDSCEETLVQGNPPTTGRCHLKTNGGLFHLNNCTSTTVNYFLHYLEEDRHKIITTHSTDIALVCISIQRENPSTQSLQNHATQVKEAVVINKTNGITLKSWQFKHLTSGGALIHDCGPVTIDGCLFGSNSLGLLTLSSTPETPTIEGRGIALSLININNKVTINGLTLVENTFHRTPMPIEPNPVPIKTGTQVVFAATVFFSNVVEIVGGGTIKCTDEKPFYPPTETKKTATKKDPLTASVVMAGCGSATLSGLAADHTVGISAVMYENHQSSVVKGELLDCVPVDGTWHGAQLIIVDRMVSDDDIYKWTVKVEEMEVSNVQTVSGGSVIHIDAQKQPSAVLNVINQLKIKGVSVNSTSDSAPSTNALAATLRIRFPGAAEPEPHDHLLRDSHAETVNVLVNGSTVQDNEITGIMVEGDGMVKIERCLIGNNHVHYTPDIKKPEKKDESPDIKFVGNIRCAKSRVIVSHANLFGPDSKGKYGESEVGYACDHVCAHTYVEGVKCGSRPVNVTVSPNTTRKSKYPVLDELQFDGSGLGSVEGAYLFVSNVDHFHPPHFFEPPADGTYCFEEEHDHPHHDEDNSESNNSESNPGLDTHGGGGGGHAEEHKEVYCFFQLEQFTPIYKDKVSEQIRLRLSKGAVLKDFPKMPPEQLYLFVSPDGNAHTDEIELTVASDPVSLGPLFGAIFGSLGLVAICGIIFAIWCVKKESAKKEKVSFMKRELGMKEDEYF